MANTPPSIDPADKGSLPGTMRHVLSKFLQNVDDMLPARVVAFNGDRDAPRVKVQPLYMVTKTDGELVAMEPIASLPVFQFGAGGFLLSFPIQAGDLGWIKANDQDISLFLQSYAAAAGNTRRMHSFEDAVFIPDAMRGYAIAGADAGNVVLQTSGGDVKLTLSTSAVRMQAGTNFVEVATGGITSSGPWAHSGDFEASGGAFTHNGVNVGATHAHSDVQTGTGTSGPPI